MKPRLYILAGANGSGKSTISKESLPPQTHQGGGMTEFDIKILSIANKAVYAAQEENRRLGIPNVYSLNGTIVWQMPDGSVTTVNPNT